MTTTTSTATAHRTTSASTTVATDASARTGSGVRRLLGLSAVAGVAATVVNAVAYGVARAADVDFVAERTATGTERIQLQHVVSLSVISFAIGLLAAAVVVRVGRPRALRALQVLGAGLAVLTTYGDFGLDGSTAAKVTLILMHVVVGVAYVGVLEVVRRSQPAAVRAATRVPSVGAAPLAA